MKSITRLMTVFGLLALVLAGLSFASAQPVLANDAPAPAFQTTPEPPVVEPPAQEEPPVQQTVVIPDTGDADADDDDTVFFGSWWLLALLGVLLIGLIIGLLSRGSHTHHID